MSNGIKTYHFFSICHVSHVYFDIYFPLSSLSDPSVDDSGAVSPDQDDKPDREKMEKHKKKVKKAAKPKYEAKGHSMFS